MTSLYGFLARRRGRVFMAALAVIALAVLSLFRLNIDNSSIVFIPDSEEEFRLAARLMGASRAASLLFVELAGENAARAAEKIENAVPDSLASSVAADIGRIGPETLTRAIPYHFDANFEKKANALLEADSLARIMAENRAALQGFCGIAGANWIRGDPLNLRRLLLERLPRDLPSRSLSRENMVLLLFRPKGSSFDTASARELLKIVRDNVPPGISLRMSGTPVHTEANAMAVERDLFRIVVYSIAGFALAYILLARSFGAIWILLTALLSTLMAVAATGAAFPFASGLVIGFGASLMGLAEDYAVHMHFGLRSGEDQASIYAALWPPLLQSFLLNCAGFVILLFSAIPAMRQISFFAIVSLGVGFFCAMAIVPFAPGFSRPRLARESLAREPAKASLARGGTLCLLLAALCAIFYNAQEFNFLPRALGANAEAIAADSEAIKKNWNFGSSTNVIIEADSRDQAILLSREYADLLRKAGARDLLSPGDFLVTGAEAEANMARWQNWLKQADLEYKVNNAAAREHFGREAFAPFFESLRLAPAELAGPVELLLAGNMAMITCGSLPDGISGQDLTRAHVFAMGQMEGRLAQSFNGEKKLIGLAALALAALIWLFLRRLDRVLAVLLPPLFSLATVLVVFWAASLPFTLAALAALPIVFGLSIDHGVMITHSLEQGKALGVRRAVVLASVTAFFSIGLLALSEHPTLRAMGIVIFSGLAAELCAALWLVPLVYTHKR